MFTKILKALYSAGDEFPPADQKSKTWVPSKIRLGLVALLQLFLWKSWLTLVMFINYIPLVDIVIVPRNRKLISKLVESTKETFVDLRPLLRINDLPFIPASSFHTHPNAAAERTAASRKIRDVIRTAGFDPYMVSMASADQLDGERGSRYFYWAKDMKADYRDDAILSNDVLVFIDVDFHCDMNEYLRYGQPVIMYTLSPDQAAYRGTEHSYTIENDVVDYTVSGGARYIHKIWDYDHEIIRVRGYDGWTIYYNVEQRVINGPMGSSRRIITLTPFVRVPHWCGGLINGSSLKRKRFTYGNVNVVYNKITDYLSLAMTGSYQAVNLTNRIYEAIKHRCSTKEKGITTVGDVETYLHQSYSEESLMKVDSSLLHQIMTAIGDLVIKPNVIPTSCCRTGFTPIVPGVALTSVDHKKTSQTLTTPLVSHSALFPNKNLASESAGINGRVTAVKNDKIPHSRFAEYARDFINYVVRKPGQGVPWDITEVIEEQVKPLQKSRIQRTLHLIGTFCSNRLKSFVKAEGYGQVNDPRIITTMKPEMTVEFSRYSYPFKKNILKAFGWYGPGKTPSESVRSIMKLSTHGTVVTDFSRYDGSISKWLTNRIVFAMYLRWVAPKHRSLVKNYLDKIYSRKAITSLGLKYNAGWGTRSGSPTTTDGNTVINAFITYASLRELGRTHKESVKGLGIYAGDDGLNAVIPGLADSIESVCCEIGLSVKMEVTKPGGKTSYLGRIFPRPSTHVDSIQDPKRTLAKIHLSANKGVSREQGAVNKAVGYLVTDAKTPIISHYCKQVLEITGGIQPHSMLSEEVYKVGQGAWPQVDQELITDTYCAEMDVTRSELEAQITAIKAAKTLDEMPVIWNNSFDPKIKALVDDEIVVPRNRKNDTIKQSDTPPQTDGDSSMDSGITAGSSGSDLSIRSKDIRKITGKRCARILDHRPRRRNFRVRHRYISQRDGTATPVIKQTPVV